MPGNPLAPQNIQNWARHVEELAKTGGRPPEIHLHTPVSRLGRNSPRACSRKGRNSVARVTTPHRKEVPVKNGTLSPIQRKHTFLPEIDKKYLARNHRYVQISANYILTIQTVSASKVEENGRARGFL